MDKFGRQKKFGSSGKGRTNLNNTNSSRPLRRGQQYGGNSTDAFMGSDCFDACDSYWLPQCSGCHGCSPNGCPSGCNCYMTCADWGSVLGTWFCMEWTHCASPGPCYQNHANCIMGCPSGGGYVGTGGGGGYGAPKRAGGRVRNIKRRGR